MTDITTDTVGLEDGTTVEVVPEIVTEEMVKRVIPSKLRAGVHKSAIQGINKILNDPEHRETLRDNMLSYMHVLNEGRFNLQDYVHAVKYVSYKLMGNSNIESYVKTFPDRYQRLVQNNTSQKDIASHVTSYNKGKLVNLIYEQTMIPTWVLNQDIFQRAINVQAEIMSNPQVSPRERVNAANSLLTHLKTPETQKVELNIGVKDDSVIQALRDTTVALAAQQRKMLEGGLVDALEVAESVIHSEVEATDIELN